VTPRLTLNVGLRYDLRSTPVERWNRHSDFDPYATNPTTKMLGVLTYAGVSAPRSFVDRNSKDFGPRVGFAYSLTRDSKTVVRGGYGIVHMLTESIDRGVLRWFDAAAFVNPPDFVVGNAPKRLPNTRGPGM
jgi:hypothetical protein